MTATISAFGDVLLEDAKLFAALYKAAEVFKAYQVKILKCWDVGAEAPNMGMAGFTKLVYTFASKHGRWDIMSIEDKRQLFAYILRKVSNAPVEDPEMNDDQLIDEFVLTLTNERDVYEGVSRELESALKRGYTEAEIRRNAASGTLGNVRLGVACDIIGCKASATKQGKTDWNRSLRVREAVRKQVIEHVLDSIVESFPYKKEKADVTDVPDKQHPAVNVALAAPGVREKLKAHLLAFPKTDWRGVCAKWAARQNSSLKFCEMESIFSMLRAHLESHFTDIRVGAAHVISAVLDEIEKEKAAKPKIPTVFTAWTPTKDSMPNLPDGTLVEAVMRSNPSRVYGPTNYRTLRWDLLDGKPMESDIVGYRVFVDNSERIPVQTENGWISNIGVAPVLPPDTKVEYRMRSYDTSGRTYVDPIKLLRWTIQNNAADVLWWRPVKPVQLHDTHPVFNTIDDLIFSPVGKNTMLDQYARLFTDAELAASVMPTINLTRNNTLNNTKENTMSINKTIKIETRTVLVSENIDRDIAKMSNDDLIAWIEIVRGNADALRSKNIDSAKIKAKVAELEAVEKQLIEVLDAR